MSPVQINTSFDNHHKITMEFHCLRLTPGQEIKGALSEFVKREGLRSAFIVTCCGSVRSATLRYAEMPDGAEKKVVQ